MAKKLVLSKKQEMAQESGESDECTCPKCGHTFTPKSEMEDDGEEMDEEED